MLEKSRSRCLVRGVSILESLAVLALLAILFAVVVPVLAQSRKRGLVSREISDLRQLGVAAAMYHDASGQWPLGTPTLVESGFAPKSIITSQGDETKEGIANTIVRRLGLESSMKKKIRTDYRRSYVGLYDYGNSYRTFSNRVLEQPGAGWLVSLTFATPHVGREGDAGAPSERFRNPDGTYLRLMLDGSVATRHQQRVKMKNREGFSIYTMYADGDKDWERSLFER